MATTMKRVTPRILQIDSNTQIQPDKFSGWLAINTGTAQATVNGYPLAPTEGLDFTSIDPNCIWGSPITIALQTGASVRITLLQYN